MHRDTEILNAGRESSHEPGPLTAGPQFSSTYVTPGDPGRHTLTYGRHANPTWTAWEEALQVLEGGPAVAYASGMAAAGAVLGVTLEPGDIAVLPTDSYYAIRTLADEWLRSLGIEVRFVETGNLGPESLSGARLVWIETPTNPELKICDIEATAALAHEHGALLAVDNTTVTSYLQQPLALGADYVVASDTKALTGHSDLVLGHVAVRDPGRAAVLRAWRARHGAIPGPMEVWLAHRSLSTLPVRMARQCESAERLATLLAAELGVSSARYPGLPSHEDHAMARRQMHGFGTVVSFDLGTRPRAERFLASLRLVREATSFGGVHSTAERRARWGGDAVSEGFIRFSVGCEAIEDLLEDVRRGLEASRD